jgi:hypothetical protein
MKSSFRFCMLIGAIALLGVSIFYFSSYLVVLKIALGNSGVQPFIQHSIQAMWLSFASQSLLIGLLYLLVAYKPHTVSREVIVLFGMVQLVEAVLLFTFAGSKVAAVLLVVASVFVLVGAMLWPRKQVLVPVPSPAQPPFDAQRPPAQP